MNSVKLIPKEISDLSFPEARFLSDEEQTRYESMYSNFGEKAKRCLQIPKEGSNLFKVLLLNQNGIRTASIKI